MVDISQNIIQILLAIVFLETGIIFGNWINGRSLWGSTRFSNILSFLAIVFFSLFVILVVSAFIPGQKDNVAVGILSGVGSGLIVLLFQKNIVEKNES